MKTRPEDPVAPPDDRSYLYPHTWQPPSGESAGISMELPPPPRDPGTRLDWGFGSVVAPPADQSASAEHAVIGNELRIPMVWCEFGACIAWFTDAAALGESDVRHRAVVAGWRRDALGRLGCPECVQHDATFRVSYPPVPASELPESPERDAWVAVLDELAHEPGSDWEFYPADEPSAFTEPSAWDLVEAPRISLAPDPEPERPGWWRRRETGRHRLSA